MEYKNTPKRRWYRRIALPFILIIIIPLIIFDVFLEIYHRICFPLYQIKTIKRNNYIKIDRHKLSYLKFMNKLFCIYCGYANGLLNYAVRIAGDTERYWCAIKHENSKNFKQPEHHKEFLEYGDKKTFDKKYNNKK